MSATRVLVTGLGTTSPVGGDVPTTWAALLEGQSGVRPLKHDWAEQLGTQIAAEVAVDPNDVLERVKARRLDRSGSWRSSPRSRRGPTRALPMPTSTRSGSALQWPRASAASRRC